MSLQPDGSVSVGLADKAFVSPDFNAQNFVWSAFNRLPLKYNVQSDAATLKPIRNPHLTFHPPNWFHLKGLKGLRGSEEKRLWEGIGDLEIMLRQDGQVPWVRFVSKRVSDLPSAGLPERPDRAKPYEIKSLEIKPQSDQSSIGLALDFVSSGTVLDEHEFLASAIIPWQGYSLHIHATELPAQVATLAWLHQY